MELEQSHVCIYLSGAGWPRKGQEQTALMTWSKKKPCNIPSTTLGHVTGLGWPSSLNAEPRRKKLMKEICREAMGVRLLGIPVEMWRGAKPPIASITSTALFISADLHRLAPRTCPNLWNIFQVCFGHMVRVHMSSKFMAKVCPEAPFCPLA